MNARRSLQSQRLTAPLLSLVAAVTLAACAGGASDDASQVPFFDGGAGGAPAPGGSTPPPPAGNRRPVLARIGDRQAEVGAALEIVLEASDPNGDPLTYALRTSAPEGAKFDKADARFSWTPTAAQLGTSAILTFEVSDGSLRDQETVKVDVVAAGEAQNAPPEIDPLGDQALTVGQPFSLQLRASDPNGDRLTYEARGAEALAGATFDGGAGLFAWTPPAEAAGQAFGLVFAVSDGVNESTSVVTLVVSGAGGESDLPPRIEPIPDQELAVGQTARIQVVAQDEAPEALVYDLAAPPPAGAVFDPAARTLTWTPTPEQAGQAYRVVFRVADGRYRAIDQVTLTVIGSGGGGGGGGGGGACTPDAGDPGVAPDPSPRPLAPGAPAQGSICGAGDEDAFTFEVPAGAAFTLDVDFVHAEGDIDVSVTGSDGFEDDSVGSVDDERIVGLSRAGGTFIARLVGYSGETNPRYAVTLSIQADGACLPDAAEGPNGNGADGDAADLRAHIFDALSVCAGDEDWFYVDLEAGATATLLVAFEHAVGDLDLAVTGPGGFSASSASADDDEEVVIDPVPATGRYYARVFGFGGASNDYLLDLTETAPVMCADDRVEPNDARADAEPLPANLYRNFTACGDDDWYRTDVPAGRELQVFLTWDESFGDAPMLVVENANGAQPAGQVWEFAEGDGCLPERSGCYRLRYRPATAGMVSYRLVDARRGMEYDLRVRVLN